MYEALRLFHEFNPGIHHNDEPFIGRNTTQDTLEISEKDPDVLNNILRHDSVNIQVYLQIPSPPLPPLNMTCQFFFQSGGQNEKWESTGARVSTVQLSVCQPHALHWRLKSGGWCPFWNTPLPLRKRQLWREPLTYYSAIESPVACRTGIISVSFR